MAIAAVRNYFKTYGREQEILEFAQSSATVELAALALQVIPARIAKTLSFKHETSCILVVTAGDAKVDNRKYKEEFGIKAKMLSPDEVLALIGHAIGGVCPFGIENTAVRVYADISLKRFETVFPACGSSNSAIELNCSELFQYARAVKWVDVCKGWRD
ncbi:YbaK/EbsC family protein|uniref:Cys-tRNA(Pro) deacylase, prolyl-tRNA editing enzyme YbaK/EbsC n=1 Tax=Dendrosporobacter quercicolus TaxID=146817 RepID=A0A1G9TVN8_9FIRM|nr:YbaK/EbsC family protein [Dendrosporobacter quercicolus]NSL48838.1 YbaK/EbsC family protein [Dendrosporobacter quercicolus DSM 1736]SDM51658.1 Cys-tRNA(Pro) deacylase, prolyl-tRNA editing enzyme YbaK/EbsC [Dendrosporobacter quercicolus]